MRYMMLDLVRLGQKVDPEIGSSVMVQNSELKAVRRALQAYGAVPHGEQGLAATIERGSPLQLVLRKHNSAEQWYLNLDGNPLSFKTGHNVYGYPNAVGLILWTYKQVFDAVAAAGTALPQPLQIRALEGEQIHLNHLEFAASTVPLPDKKELLNAWRYMYGRSRLWSEDKGYQSLDRMLGLRVINPEYDNSFSLAFMSGTNRELQFMAYDKHAEYMAHRGIEVEDMRDRLRLEIGLMPRWFEVRKIRDLADMRRYIDVKHGRWTDFISETMQDAIDRAYLTKMFEFDVKAVLRAITKNKPLPKPVENLNRRIVLMMLEARLEYRVTDRDLLDKLRQKKSYLKRMARGDFDVPNVLGLELETKRIKDEDALRKSQGGV